MLDDLVQTIETLKQRIKDHRDHIQNYESRTRVTLIDPLLRALGWDVSDPSIVRIEHNVDAGRPDYALLGMNTQPVLFVEAKKLAENASPVAQIVSYVVTENIQNKTNVRYGASTNGDTWDIYDVIEQRPVMQVSVAKDDLIKCALKFLSLWRRSMADGVFDTAVEPVVDPVKPKPTVSPPPIEPTPVPIPINWTPLTGDFESTHKPPPLAIKFPNSEDIIIRSWTGVVIQTALWLFESHLLTRDNCRIKVGKSASIKRYILSDDGKHSTGTLFHSPVPIPSTGIIMESSYNPNDLIRNAQILLRHFGQDPAQVFLKLS